MTPHRPRTIRPTDLFIRWAFGDTEPPALVADGENLAWLGRASRPGELWITGMGDDPAVVARLVEELAQQHAIDGVTVSEMAFGLLPERLRSPDPGHWCFWVLDPADAVLAPTRAVALELDDPRIAPLLEHSESAHVFPGHPRLVRWAGVSDQGRLAAVAGQIIEPTGAAHVVSVFTDVEYRGQGLARDACMGVIQGAVDDGAPMLILEMYVKNGPGRRLYNSLGFTEVGRFLSGLLRPTG